MKTTTKKYCRHLCCIMCICNLFIDSSISGSNSQHSMLAFTRNVLNIYNKYQGITQKHLLTYLIKYFFPDVYMDDILYTICQIHHVYLEQYFSRSLLQLIYIGWDRKISTIKRHTILSTVQQYINSKILPRNIADIYVSIMSIFHLFIDFCISGSNNQHSMLAFHKEYFY